MALPKLGEKARDRVTGVTGTVTCDARYLGGRRQFLLEGPGKGDNPTLEVWVDKARIERDDVQANPGVGGDDQED